MHEKKAALRRHFRIQRKSLTPENHANLSQKASAHLLAFLSLFPGKNLGAYWPTGSEIDIRMALNPLAEKWSIYLPKVGGEKMHFHKWKPGQNLVKHTNGIFEPPATASICPSQEIDVILVPLLAVDRLGVRLGQGGGYYDRFLPSCSALTIGCGFQSQLSSAPLPAEPHDSRLVYFLSENGLLPFPLDS